MALNTITLTPNLTKKHVMVTTQRRCQFQPRGLHESLTWLLMHCLCSSKREVFFFSFCKQCPGWQPSWISDQHKKLAHIYKATTGLLLPGYLWLPSWISDQQQKIKTLQWVSEWVSEWLLFNDNTAIFQLYHGEKRLMLIFNEIMMRSSLY